MGLKQDIVMKKEFTNKYQGGKHGTTPGAFITRYISRKNAAEPITVVDLKADEGETDIQFKHRYLRRRNLVDKSIANYDDEKKYQNLVKQRESLDGKAFGNDGVSYSNKYTRKLAKKVQALYDKGHSVSKLVFSFAHDYMKKHHMISDDYVNTGHGSLRGKVDQLRVRTAVNEGMDALTKEGDYVNPIWVATVHSNTDDLHVHCVLVDDVDLDKSKRLVPGQLLQQDYGFVNATQAKKFRHAVDAKFKELDTLAVLNDEQVADVNNLELMSNELQTSHYRVNNTLQKLTASLPKDAVKWDSDKEPELMKRPNEWLNTYVAELMHNYPSRTGWDALKPVMQKRITQVPDYQRQQYSLYLENAFYKLSEGYILDDIKDDIEYQPLTEHNPYLTQQAVDNDNPDEMQAAFDLNIQETNNEGAAISLRQLIQYQKRQKKHADESDLMQEQLELFDLDHRSESDYMTEPPIRNWYKAHAKAERARVDKYRYLLKANNIESFSDHNLNEDYKSLLARHNYVSKLSQVDIPSEDAIPSAIATAIKQSEPDEVLKYKDLLNKAYNGQPLTVDDARRLDEFGGDDSELLGTQAYYSKNPDSFREDSFNIASDYAMALSNYSYKCWENGLIKYDEVEDTYDYMQDLMKGRNHIPLEPSSDIVLDRKYFDDVKGSDLHDLLNDIPNDEDRSLSNKTINMYKTLVTEELDSDTKADSYLAKHGNESPYITDALHRDTEYLKFADAVEDTHGLPLAKDSVVSGDSMLPEDLTQLRNLSAMSMADADFDSNKHLQLIKNVSETYRLQLLEEIKQYETQQQQVVNDNSFNEEHSVENSELDR